MTVVAMGKDIDHQPASYTYPKHSLSILSETTDHQIMQPTGTLSLNMDAGLVASSIQDSFCSAFDTLLASNLASQFSQSTPLPTFSSSNPWRAETFPDCMSIGTKIDANLATRVDGYHCLLSSEKAMDSQSSANAILDLGGLPPLSYTLEHKSSSSLPKTDNISLSPCPMRSEGYFVLPLSSDPYQRPENPFAHQEYPKMPPLSPVFSNSSDISQGLCTASYDQGNTTHCLFETDDIEMGDTDEGENSEPPYSQLIYQALASSPGMKLPLQGIYNWFEKNTAKGKDPNSKGWQNSIRHNLSMNAGFEAVKVESPTNEKAINFWKLTEEAAKHGVQSTTRYRKHGNHKKSLKSETPAPQRQRSGAKGGRASKIAAKFRRAHHAEQKTEQFRQTGYAQWQDKDGNLAYQMPSSYLHALTPAPPAEPFSLEGMAGCADPSLGLPLLYDTDRKPACVISDLGSPDAFESHPVSDSVLNTW